MTSYAIILTHNRPEMLQRCVAAIAPQVDRVIVLDNASDPPMTEMFQRTDWPENTEFYVEPMQPPNLAKLWNMLFHYISVEEEYSEHEAWDIAVLCDDAIAPPDWFATVRDGMRAHNAAAACTHPLYPIFSPIVKTEPDADLFNRMCGWAFMLAGEKHLRADVNMHWWYVDDDLSNQARLNGGLVILPGPQVPNELPNGWTNAKPELSAQAGRDRAEFHDKWGMSW